MLVAPCYIIVYNAFALTGRTRRTGVSKPQGAASLCPGLCANCPFRSDKFGCARHSIQGKLDALLSLARTVRADTNQRHQPLCPHLERLTGHPSQEPNVPCDISTLPNISSIFSSWLIIPWLPPHHRQTLLWSSRQQCRRHGFLAER